MKNLHHRLGQLWRAIVPAMAFVVLAGTHGAHAAALRYQTNQRGDFVLIGNTLGQDCGPGVPAPAVGTIGPCGSNTSDTAADIFWQSNDPTGANADTSITAATARSTAVLTLPAGATVTYARLYWSATPAGTTPNPNVTLDRVGTDAFTAPLVADATFTAVASSSGNQLYYESSVDVTALVVAHGSGPYRISNVDSVSLLNLNNETIYAAWSLVVLYQLDSAPPRNLAVFDGLDLINSQGPSVTVTLSGFLVPNAGFDAKLGVVAYEGDNTLSGDALSWNGVALSDALNPVNNFFNGTHSYLGAAVSTVGDLPQLAGTAGSLTGVDLDVVDVTSRVARGDTSATITASTNQDFYLLGAFVTSISTYKPDFTGTAKTVTDLTTHPGGAVLPGDTIEYSIAGTNTGNDGAINTTLNDPLPAGVTYVPGSIRIVSGANSGTKTDATGDDQGEYISATRTVRVRLGVGANGTQGGAMAIGDSSTVAFRVTVNAGTIGPIQNQATITAGGAAGAPAADYVSNGNGTGQGTTPTTVVIDQCADNTGCSGVTPFCLTTVSPRVCVSCLADSACAGTAPRCDGTTHVCRACAADADCSAGAPVCLASGACGQCSATETGLCAGTTSACDVPNARCVECVNDTTCASPVPVCNVSSKTCVGCLGPSDCGGATPTCDAAARTCRGCAGDGECGGTTPACQPTGACGICSAGNSLLCGAPTPLCLTSSGTCVGCTTAADCPGATPVCDGVTHVCRGCGGDGECGGGTPACQPSGRCGVCSVSNPSRCAGTTTPVCDVTGGTCVGCETAADCSGGTPICDGVTHVCRPCGADTDCGATLPVCATTGQCVQCVPGKTAACASPRTTCDPTDRCVQCLTGADCSGPTPVCDPTGTCRPCGGNGDCGGGTPLCLASGACGVCSAADPSRCPSGAPLCDTSVAAGRCVGCLSATDCGGVTPVCSASTRTCAGCTADGAPSCPDPTRPACQHAGPLAGACTECSATDALLCLGLKPQCIAATGLCGCAGPTADPACGGPTSGIICTSPGGSCGPGCGPSPRNDCPTGQTCVDITAGVGRCAPAQGCTGDAGCQAPAPVCVSQAGSTSCVSCLTDSDCPAPTLCAPATNTCVTCTPANATACSPDLAGSRCLTGGQCGCQSDGDCGSVTSGRICDVSLGRCVPGCHDTGGNGCPVSEVCSMVTGGVGHCTGAGTPDGGAGVADGGRDAGDGGRVTDGGGGAVTDGGRHLDGAADGGGRSTTDGAAGHDGSGGGHSGSDGGGVSDGARPRNDGGAARGDSGDENPDSAFITDGRFVAGGGCRCDASSGSTPGAMSLFGLLLVAVLARARGRRGRRPADVKIEGPRAR